MKNYLRISILVICVFTSGKTMATHMLGADIQYRFIHKDTLEVIVSAYKDCKGMNMTSAALNVTGIGCKYSSNYYMSQVTCKDATSVCKSSCTKCDASNCNASAYPNGSNPNCTFGYGIEKLIFKQIVVLKNTNCCNFRLDFSQSARSANLTTCCNYQNNLQNFYVFADVNRCLTPLNSSPIMMNDPISIVCSGSCVNMNIGAIDTVDHDYITYHLVPVLESYGSSCIYVGSYTYQQPFYYDGFSNNTKYNSSTCKGLFFDSATGDFFFKPMQQEVAQYAIELREWRRDSSSNLQLIGRTRRDMVLFIMANCTNSPPALPSKNAAICAGDKICFDSIQSIDTNKKDTVLVTWNGGIPKGKFSKNFKKNNIKQYFNFCWQTDSSDVESVPYVFTVTAHDNACPLLGITSRSYSIFVGGKLDSSKIKYKIAPTQCGGIKLTVNYDSASGKYGIKYKWTVDGIQYDIKDTTIKTNKTGWHIVKLVVSSSTCFSIQYTDSIYIDSLFNANIDKDTFICSPSQILFKANSINGTAPYKYQWYTNSMLKDTLDTLTYYANISDVLQCKITDSLGCASIANVKITVDSLSLFSLGADQWKCSGDSVVLQAPSNMNGYLWREYKTGDTLSANNYYRADSDILLQCNITDKFSCNATDTITINFAPKVMVDLGPDKHICSNSTVILTAKGAGTHEWYINNQNVNTGDTYYDTPVVAQLITAKGFQTLNNVTCEGIDSVYIDLFAKPVVNLKDSFYVCQGDTAALIASGNTGSKYKWNNGDSGNVLYTKFIGKYSVALTDSNGCKASAQTELFNFPLSNIYLTFSNDTLYANTNSSVFNYIWSLDSAYYYTSTYPWEYLTKTGIYRVKIIDSNGCTVSSQPYTVTTLHNYILNPHNVDGIKVYPNPSTGTYYIESSVAINDLMIYDLTGRKVYNSSAKNNIIDLSSQPEGIYLLQINKNIWVRLSKL